MKIINLTNDQSELSLTLRWFPDYRFHYKIWRRWRSQNHDVVLLVKHFSADVDRSKNLVNEKSEDKNNNSDRTTAPILFGVSFTHEEDPVYTMRQHTTFVWLIWWRRGCGKIGRTFSPIYPLNNRSYIVKKMRTSCLRTCDDNSIL